VGLAAELIDRWAPILRTVNLVTGDKGVFKVWLDGALVFDRKAIGRHANPGEVERAIEGSLGPRLEWR
jgi:selenoprotein W-related protein